MQNNKLKLAMLTALIGLATVANVAMATDMDATTTRDQRMGDALQTYRGGTAADKNPNPGRFARAEEATKRGARKTGHAIQHGAQRAGHAVSTGVEKTGDAIRRTGDKMKSKTTRSSTTPQ